MGIVAHDPVDNAELDKMLAERDIEPADMVPSAAVSDFAASGVAGLVTELNGMLGKFRTAGIVLT